MKQLLLILLLFTGCIKKPIASQQPHSCRWEHCPYKEILPIQYAQSVLEYTESLPGTDAYEIDILHLEYPADDYDALNDRLLERSQPESIQSPGGTGEDARPTVQDKPAT